MNTPNLCDARLRTNKKVDIKKDLYELSDNQKKIGLNQKYYVKTYGCQMNEHDSENIKAILEEMAYTEANDMNEADLIILNTCAIRENAHNKVFGMAGRIKHLKESKHVLLGIGGCMPQEEHIVNEIINKHKYIDFVFGTHNIYDLPNIIESSLSKQVIEVYSIEGDVIENIPAKRDSKYKAWVNIMYGCDKFCTYCIVPYTRGKQRSRMPLDIINEIKDLIKEGYLEINLLGQNVNAYGKDLDINYNLANLLADISKLNIKRIRFITSHPWDFSDDMIKVIKDNKNIMPYIHLPIQSGSDSILKKMNRHYTINDYKILFNKLKKEIPNVAITTDIIVGFPNETEEDFNNTLDIVKYCEFDSAFTFIYSKRVGTPAASIIDNISLAEKELRLSKLNKLVNEYALKKNKTYINKIVPVLIEGVSEKEGLLMGYTDTMKLVNVKGDQKHIGTIQNVKITSVKTWSMNGEII